MQVMANSISGGQAVSGSTFGDNARLQFVGSYTVNVPYDPSEDQPSQPIRSADEQFLSALSLIDPENQWFSVKRERTKAAQEGRDWPGKTSFDAWFANGERTHLWIQDKTLRQEGGSLLVSDIIEDLKEQSRLEKITPGSVQSTLGYFYLSCLSKEKQEWTPSHVLGGLICTLLRGSTLLQTIRHQYERRLKASLMDDTRFQALVDILLDILQSSTFTGLGRITLIVEAIDLCGADSKDIGDLVEVINEHCRMPNLRWIISSAARGEGLPSTTSRQATSASSQVLEDLDLDFHILELTHSDVYKGIGGLDAMINTIADVGAWMQTLYEGSKCQAEKETDGYRWFQHSKAGAAWLEQPERLSDDYKGACIVWYERNIRQTHQPSPMALHIADCVNNRIGLQLDTFYYSCLHPVNFVSRTPDYYRSKGISRTQPAVVLFCMFSQMMHRACRSRDDWERAAVDLPKKLRKQLGNLTSKIHDYQRRPRTSNPGAALPEVAVETQMALDESSKIHDTMTTVPQEDGCLKTRKMGLSADVEEWYYNIQIQDRYTPVIVELIAFVAPSLPHDILLVFDSLEQMDWAMWQRSLPRLKDSLSSRVRILLCGNSEIIDRMLCTVPSTKRPDIDDWRKLVGSRVDEHSEYEECLRSLHFDAIHSRRHEITDAWPETNQWLRDNSAFKSWIDHGGVLWIHGKAGSGKSVLAKTILKILKSLVGRLGPGSEQISPWFVCDWFYNARGTEIDKSHLSMLRSLAYEILRSDERAYECVKTHYRTLDLSAERPVWSLSKLTSLLRGLVTSPLAPETVTVIDALDESEDGNQGTSENRLSIVSSLCNIASQSRGQLRIIILSRPDPLAIMARQLRLSNHQWREINLQEHNHEDIMTIVDSGLETIRDAWASVRGFSHVKHPVTRSAESLSQPMKFLQEQEEELAKIKEYLITNSSGVVLWVCLVLHELRDRVKSEKNAFTLGDLTEALYQLPADLYGLYAHIISSLNPTQDLKRTVTIKKILTWVIGSAPLGPLTLQQLLEAIALPDNTGLDGEKWSRDSIGRKRIQIGPTWDTFCHILHQYCGPLIEVKSSRTQEELDFFQPNEGNSRPVSEGPRFYADAEATWTIHLLHLTAKTFLGDEERSGQFYINSELAAISILDSCYQYLGLKPPQPDVLTFETYLRNWQSPSALREGLPGWAQLSCHKCETVKQEYSHDRPLYEFAMAVVEGYLPFQNISIMYSIQGGNDQHDLRDCFVVYCILDAFRFGNVLSSKTHDIRSFFRQCCLRGNVKMLEVTFGLMEKHKDSWSRPGISGQEAYEVVRGAVEALIERSSDLNRRCIWRPSLPDLLTCYSRYAMVVDTISTTAIDDIDGEQLDEAIDVGLNFLENVQREYLESIRQPARRHDRPISPPVNDHVEEVDCVSLEYVYDCICQIVLWVEKNFVDASQHDLEDIMNPWYPGTKPADSLGIFTEPWSDRRYNFERAMGSSPAPSAHEQDWVLAGLGEGAMRAGVEGARRAGVRPPRVAEPHDERSLEVRCGEAGHNDGSHHGEPLRHGSPPLPPWAFREGAQQLVAGEVDDMILIGEGSSFQLTEDIRNMMGHWESTLAFGG